MHVAAGDQGGEIVAEFAPELHGPLVAMASIVETLYLDRETRDKAISVLQTYETDLRRLGVERLYLFGSTARDEATDASDVDLFFDYEKGTLGLFELMDVKSYAASVLGCPTDIITRDSLHELIRASVEAAAVRIF